jgi:fructokinase
MILSIGEILVDIFEDGENKTVFPGGAPFNLAANIAYFNKDAVTFLGSVGDDDNGHFLHEVALKGIKRPYIFFNKERHTSEAIVTLSDGERSFRFNRDNGCDYILDINELKKIDLSSLNIVHIGSLMLSYQEGRQFFYEAIKYIKENSNALISFDVNYRDDIFGSKEEAKEIFINALKEADIIKFTEDELELLSGHKDLLKGLKTLLNDNQVAVITLGKEGSVYYDKNKFIKVATFPMVPVDTTGAGDAFYSYFLYSFDKGFDKEDDEDIKNTLVRANIVGGFATQKKGAIGVVPSLEEIEEFLAKHR